MANAPHVLAQRKLADSLLNSPRMVRQRHQLQGMFGAAAQLQGGPSVSHGTNTGLPHPLRAGIESLSGISMDNVRVHYNSSRPPELNALAYAQGTDIHLAPGQERHLPHEAWHVVQQAQGRVRPTAQLKEGIPVNDDQGLEREADTMGAKALSMPAGLQAGVGTPTGNSASVQYRRLHGVPAVNQAVQLAGDYSGLLPDHTTHKDTYKFGVADNDSSEFTYHHIIPENLLKKVFEKIEALLATNPASVQGARLTSATENLKAGGRNLWIETRAKNTAAAVNNEFGLDLSPQQILPLVQAHTKLDALFPAVRTLVKDQLRDRFLKLGAPLSSRVSNLVKTDFIKAWSGGKASAVTPYIIELLEPFRMSGMPLFDVAEVTAIVTSLHYQAPRGTNKGKLVEEIGDYARGKSFDSFCAKNIAAPLRTVVQRNGLPRHEQDELRDAIEWNPGNIHRGPKSEYRLNAENAHNLWDDGGSKFEHAAVNLIATGHFTQVELLSRNITVFLADNTDPPSEATLALAAGIVGQMLAIQAVPVTPFDKAAWEKHTDGGGGDRMRVKQNNVRIVAASGITKIFELGRAANVPGI